MLPRRIIRCLLFDGVPLTSQNAVLHYTAEVGGIEVRGENGMRSSKGSHRIIVQEVEYRWRAKGQDGYISLGIWPTNNVGPFMCGSICYYETWVDNVDGSWSSNGDQIVVTNRLIRRIIKHAIIDRRYDPNEKGKELHLRLPDEVIKFGDAVRAYRRIHQ
jgi:hypothetical protein